MFGSTDDLRGSDAIGQGTHVPPREYVADPLQSGTMTDIDLRLLPAGTQLSVNTRNSQYRLLLLDESGCHALVQGGRYVCEETVARIAGATCNGRSVRVGWICLGLHLEISVHGRRIVTSSVRAINVKCLGAQG